MHGLHHSSEQNKYIKLKVDEKKDFVSKTCTWFIPQVQQKMTNSIFY